jgi:phosphohistidine phosphatase
MATLLLIRHAKAGRPAGVADIDRDLTIRGARDAALVGAFLATALPHPGVVVSSPARRAHRTADLVAAAAGWSGKIRVHDRLYQGGVGDLLRVLAEAGGDPVVAFGHEPVWSAAVATIVGGGEVAMPTGAGACVEGDAEPGGGVLRWLITPAALGGGRS